MAYYANGTLISGSGNIPELTLAQYNALAVKPTYWVRTDLDYTEVEAEDITYDNTNSGLTADDVQEAIDEVVTVIDDSSAWTALDTGIAYKKISNIVTVEFDGGNPTSLPNNSWTTVATLPEGYRPTTPIHNTVALGSSATGLGLMQITSNGRIQVFHSMGSTATYIWSSVSFPCM